MKKIWIGILVFVILLTGCGKEKKEEKKSNNNFSSTNNDLGEELFLIGTTLDNGRYVTSTFDIPYNGTETTSLHDALLKNELSVNDFFKKLELIDALEDGGSKLYKYNKDKKKFGIEDFYVMACNSLDGIKDIYIAKNRKILEQKCQVKIDDLEGVSMRIEMFSKIGATVVITDTSNRENVYGNSYKIEKQENGLWIELVPKEPMAFNSMGYMVGKDHTLKFTMNWLSSYGELANGTYRIVKDASYVGEATPHYLTAEFKI